MKVHLMYPDRDFDPGQELSPHVEDLMQDLQLRPVLDAMAGGDAVKLEMATAALFAGCDTPEQVEHRHSVLEDCATHRTLVTELYDLATSIMEDRRRIHRTSWMSGAESKLALSVNVLEVCLPPLHRLHDIAATSGRSFTSTGFRRFFDGLRRELDGAYLTRVEQELGRLRFNEGLLLSAALGEGNTGVDFVLRAPDPSKRSFFRRVPLARPTRSFTIPDRDMASYDALRTLRDHALNAAADAAEDSVSHVIDFFTILRHELAFYLACLNLADALTALGQDACLPVVDAPGTPRHRATGLYDAGLALDARRTAVPSDLDTEAAPIVIVTGANRGGKSTFLRAIGIAALLMRCGCYVPARSYRAPLFPVVLTHFRREEDEQLTSGKFDEELARMAAVADRLTPGSLLLCNESFSSTNEREGSQIAEEVLRALADTGVEVVMVTHLYELTQRLGASPTRTTFLRAQRGEGGERPYRVVPGRPEPTSHAADLYRRIFANGDANRDASGDAASAAAFTAESAYGRGPS